MSSITWNLNLIHKESRKNCRHGGDLRWDWRVYGRENNLLVYNIDELHSKNTNAHTNCGRIIMDEFIALTDGESNNSIVNVIWIGTLDFSKGRPMRIIIL